jgi:hypothetical protein
MGFRPEVFTRPQWDGGKLDRRRILVYGEQGFGDVIQFARYLKPIAQRGGEIILVCPRPVQSLLKTVAAGAEIGALVREWVALGEPFPPHDVYCAIMSLPRVLKTTMANIPSEVPYLAADPAKARKWGARLAGETRLKVGLVWAGRAAPDPTRSMRFEDVAPLAGVPGIRWISLQKDEAGAPHRTPAVGMEISDWTGEFQDFSDTAALVANLDLVVTIDTSVAHLAGAMGKPVWTLLSFMPDWRWFDGRVDSPWYPTMRLFRQNRRGDWESVVKEVAAALPKWMHKLGVAV